MAVKKFQGVSHDMIRQIVSKIEKLEEEKRETAEYISDAYKEAKSQGFDSKVIRQLIAKRKKDPAQIAEQLEMLELYESALEPVAGKTVTVITGDNDGYKKEIVVTPKKQFVDKIKKKTLASVNA